MQPERVVLREGVGPDDIDDAIHSLSWQLSNLLPAMAGQPAQMILYTRDGKECVYVVEEARLGVLYAASASAAALEQLRSKLDCHVGNGVDLAAAAAGAADLERWRRALAVLVLHARSATAAVVAALTGALENEQVQVRGAGLVAASYAPWPELRGALVGLRDGDPEPQLRTAAHQLLTAMGVA